MILPCPSRDNGDRISEFPEGGALALSPRAEMNEKRCAIVDMVTYQDVEWLI
jgi:hypothetical protein